MTFDVIGGKRRYGAWAGQPNGKPENPSCCIVEVWPKYGWIPCQCSRKRGHGPDGLFCKQHAKKREVELGGQP